MMTALEALIAADEGYRRYPYRCPAGKLTIGYGYNLDAGMTEDEALLLMRHRLGKTRARCEALFPWFSRLSVPRQQVVLSMGYQLGMEGLLKFTRLITALGRNDYPAASREMLDSKWAKSDSPARAQRLAEMMRMG